MDNNAYDTKLFASCLLILRLISTGFLLATIKQQFDQYRVRKLTHQPRADIIPYVFGFKGSIPIASFTRSMLLVACVICLLSQIAPFIIDIATLTDTVERARPYTIGVVYAFSNAFFSMFLSFILWLFLYVLERFIDKLQKEGKVLKAIISDKE